VIRRWLLGLGFVALLSVDGWGCGGDAGDLFPPPGDPGSDGWVCSADLSLCTCDGVVRPVPDTRGLCLLEVTP
jgi:hypothetical protein